MLYQNANFQPHDLKAIEKLKDFIPDKVFDAHAHVYDSKFMRFIHPEDKYGKSVSNVKTFNENMSKLLSNPKVLRANFIVYPDKCMASRDNTAIQESDEFLIEQLNADPLSVGEILVHPLDSAEDIEKRLVHKNIRGLKCYHLLCNKTVTWDLDIGEYLPESAWEVANKHKLVITLHMVKDDALSDPANLSYIKKMTKKYPSATLILAHCARSFAGWTAIETIDQIADIENIWYDFSGICESPTMMAILKKTNVERCMWGSDFPVSNIVGKAISLADGFHWFYQDDYKENSANAPKKFYHVGIENLLAVRQAFNILDLSDSKKEDFFYNNADKLWK